MNLEKMKEACFRGEKIDTQKVLQLIIRYERLKADYDSLNNYYKHLDNEKKIWEQKFLQTFNHLQEIKRN